MSSVLVHIPDDGWISSKNKNMVSDDKMLCIVVHRYGDRTPAICQFRKADWLNRESDYFLDVSEKWRLDAFGCGDEWEPGLIDFSIITYWKPLGLLPEDNRRILNDIEEWFEE